MIAHLQPTAAAVKEVPGSGAKYCEWFHLGVNT